MRFALLCPLHRIEDLENLRKIVDHQSERADEVLLFLNGEAQGVPDQPWAATYRGAAQNVSTARNSLLRLASEASVDWGIFLDSDDYYSPYWVELCKHRARTLGVSAFGLDAGWTWYDGRLMRFTDRRGHVPLGGTISTRIVDAEPFQGNVAEEIDWVTRMRGNGTTVQVLDDVRGYCYIRRTGKGTARFTEMSLRCARGHAEDFGNHEPSAIDSNLDPQGHLLRPLPLQAFLSTF